MLYYTKVLFKRPSITEESERKRLVEAKAKTLITEATVSGLIDFPPVTINIEAYPADTPEGDTPPAPKGRLHYATVAFAVEIRDVGQRAIIEDVRPVIMDKLLSIMAHKPFHELTSVQGRYVLRTQIMEIVNHLAENLPSHPPSLLSAAPKKEKKGEGHGEEHAEAKPEGEEHGGGEGEHGGEGKGPKKPPTPTGPPIKELYRDGLATNVFFSQFLVQ